MLRTAMEPRTGTDTSRHASALRSPGRLATTLLCLLFLFAGCTPTPETPLHLGTNVWPGYEPLYLARELGYLDGRTIQLIEYPSASEVMRAFRNQSLEVAAVTLDEAILLRQKDIPVKIFLVTDISNGADVIVGRPGIERMEDLRGKRIGVETGALGAFVISRALEKHGMTLADVEIVALEVSEHETHFAQGRVDAVVTFEPVRTRLLQLEGVEVFTSREIPNEIVDVLAIHETALARDPEAVEALTEGWFRALDHLRHSPDEAARIMAARLNLTPDEVLASYDGLILPSREANARLLDDQAPLLRASADTLQESLLEWRLISEPVDTQGLFTSRHLE